MIYDPLWLGLRTDSTVIRSGRLWGRLEPARLARFGRRPRPESATPMAPFAQQVLRPVL
ncbi:hypothetical protein [Desulforamulus hydrothermalis]|uniref:Uncharacterized protein n=1 Tax=Desulforamulus hydrothermalis Lam5 = DSM 18033 TaxID=1121428 RepID=K8DX64_9FIRM|nr:hypothetical protein [Desulforamulus hydrothermalis]CCO07152.1 hypothetical protein DESHY_110096 [Desulforamulus hydrothermalis Lam5 = DSM 18033]